MPNPAETPSARGRSLPTWAALAVAVGLIAVVALASRSTTVSLSGALDARLGFRAIEVVGYVAVFIGLALLPWVIVLRARHRAETRAFLRSKQRMLPPAPPWVQVIGIALIGGVVVAQVYVVIVILNDILRARAAPDEASAEPGADADGGGPSFADGDPTALGLATLIVIAIAVTAVVFVVRSRRDDEAFRDEFDVQREIGRQAAEVSLEAIAREPDPRRAIIAAYAAMERSLSRAGLGRVASEAPVEYLERVLAGSVGAAGGEIRTVSQLFQVAKFSVHPVDESMRSEAIAALERIRSAGPASATAAPA